MNRLSQLIVLVLVAISLSACDHMRKFEVKSQKRMYQRMSDRISGSTTADSTTPSYIPE